MKVLITGASGFIGAHLTELLLNSGMTVIGTFRNQPFRLTHPNLVKVQTNLDKDGIGELLLLHEPDYFIHAAAANPSVTQSDEEVDYYQFNHQVTMSIVNEFVEFWSARNKASPAVEHKLINLSTYEVYGETNGQSGHGIEANLNPLTDYARSKAKTHQAIATLTSASVQLINVVLSNNYGPGQSEDKLIPAVVKKLLDNQSVDLYGDGSSKRTWTYVADTCEGLLHILRHGRKRIYHLCSKEDATVKQMVISLHLLLKKKNRVLTKAPKIKWNPAAFNPSFKIDNSSMVNELQWQASNDLLTGLKRTLDYLLRE